ncbi:MAG: LysE family translocator [Pseudomonadota bacterium]
MGDWLPLMTYCFVMSSTPGPNNVMVTASGAHFGYRGTLPHILGIHFGGFVQTCITCLGLGNLFERWPTLHAGLRVAGALYLLWLAWTLIGSVLRERHLARPLSFFEAAAFQAINPKSWVKSITLATVFMPADMGVALGTLVVAGTGVLVGVPCISAWALGGVAIRGWLSDPLKLRAFNLVMAATLVVLAWRFLS